MVGIVHYYMQLNIAYSIFAPKREYSNLHLFCFIYFLLYFGVIRVLYNFHRQI